jgi:hypothetical protein
MYETEYRAGLTFADFLESAEANAELWKDIYRRATVSDEAVWRARRFIGKVCLLVVSADWCGDAVNTVPYIARLADDAGLDLRIIDRDAHPHVIDAHLTRGARSIPVALLLDRTQRELGWWGPRPEALQKWFVEEGMPLPSGERYRELRRWYAMDRGQTTVGEIVRLLEHAPVKREAA